MNIRTLFTATAIATLFLTAPSEARRPAPPPSRYIYVLKFDVKALPKGVTIRDKVDDVGSRHFISNTSDVPFIFNERFQGDRLIAGTKLVSGKVYQYYPNGVPIQGKRHLKGWQAPFDISSTMIHLNRPPTKIYEGRKAGVSKDLPKPEPFTFPAKYNGKPFTIKGMIHYKLNKAYDKKNEKKAAESKADG